MRTVLLPAFLATLLLGAATATAQTAREGAGANAQLIGQLQQLASERTQLQADNARLKRDLDDTKKRLKALEGEKEQLSRNAQSAQLAVSRSSDRADSLEQSLARQKTRMDELIAKFRETATTLRDAENDRAGVKEQLAARERELETCAERNVALYSINGEILDRLENQGFWSSLGKAEPFTKLKRVEIENLVDDYRGRAEDQRVEAPDAAKSPGG
jgi:chromosome segregation ATPase